MSTKIALFLASLVASAFAAPNIFERADCTTNACLSALATRTAIARPDCTSFRATTVTPCAKTVKKTVTLTSTQGCSFTGPSSINASTVTTPAACPVTKIPTKIPTYATRACHNSSAYASACGCINGRAIKTTLPVPTTTTTIYTTVKANPTFYVKQVSGGFYTNYFVTSGTDPDVQPESPLFLTQDNTTPEYWTLATNGTLFGKNGTVAWTSDAQNCYGCFDNVYELPISARRVPMTCKLGDKNGDYFPLTCTGSNGATRFQNCSPDGRTLDIGGQPNTDFMDCFVANLGAYPVCS